jgi:glycosyltransferase involved in cell wall biosynthesis
MPGLRIARCVRPPFIRRVKIGPSWPKVPLDLSLFFTAMRLAMTRRYDAVHSHEEGGALGILIAWLLRVPHLYDMHSSLPQQIANFGYSNRAWLSRLLAGLERQMIRRSRVVIVICPELEDTVKAVDPDVPTVLIENAPGSGDRPTPGTGDAVRQGLGLRPDVPVIMYTGTFEAYQGLELLYEAMSRVLAQRPDAKLVLVGGDVEQVEAARARVQALGLGQAVTFPGQRPAEDIPAYLDGATVLVSPRSTGTNTPLKIYQYLRSGRPIVATRLRTHTQVLSDDTAFLADPTPDAFAKAILEVLTWPDRAAETGARARALADTKYSDEAFIARTQQAVGALVDRSRPEAAGGVA